MKAIKLFSYVLCTIIMMSAINLKIAAADAYAPEVGDGYISFDFNKIFDEIVNGALTAEIEKNVTFEGKTAVKVTPTPSTSNSSMISLDSYSLADYASKVEIPKYKYVGITYYYDTDNPTYSGKANFRILPGSTSVVASSVVVESNQNIVTNQWAEAYFRFNSIELNENASGNYITQTHFRPFGSMNPTNLTSNDVIYIASYTFYEENPDPNLQTTLSFVKGTSDAIGNDITATFTVGSTYTLPENPFINESATFIGWTSSADNLIYEAGTQVTVGEYNVTYTATWETLESYADYISIDFTEYEDGIASGRDTATVEIVEKDGRNVVKVTPNPASTSSNYITVDGYSYKPANIDLSGYRWVSIEYLYESPAPIQNQSQYLSILTGSTKVLASGKTANVYAEDNITSGKWSVSLFDFSVLDDALDPEKDEHILSQMHFRPYGNATLSSLSTQDIMYISRIVFYRDEPTLTIHEPYISGNENGYFNPEGSITRAEACKLIAGVLEDDADITGTPTFTDVPEISEYARYIGFCQERGLLDSYGDSFLPNQAITKAEFAELVYLTGLKADMGITVSFADVPQTHSKYSSIMSAASAGLIYGDLQENDTVTFSPDSTITRAKAVTIINRALDRSSTFEDVSGTLIIAHLDVDDSHPYFAQIAEASIPHMELSGKWLYTLVDPVVTLAEKIDESEFYDLAGGSEKVAELDELESERIAQIRATPNMDLADITGVKVYVSSSTGNDSNDGLTEETPVKTVAKANTIVNAGGAVLLKRGDLWREQFNAKANVTYTAYGTGAKPVLYGSPENAANDWKWSLVYENTQTGALIWKYYDETMLDVGSLVLNEGEGYAMKEIPSSNGATFVKRNDPNTVFDYTVELDNNFEFFHAANSTLTTDESVINAAAATGPLYFRCDNGNPGKVFDSIEFIARGSIIRVDTKSNVTIDNLCLMYSAFGISAGTQQNLTITNCEIGWIGGNVQTYSYGSNTTGKVVRYGNGIEVYGGCDGYVIDNCYLYQCYDAGVTHQVSGSTSGNIREDNIVYSNNVITDCVYSIEYFLSADDANENSIREGDNVVFENNLLRRAGFGFGSFRPDANNQRHIRSGTSRNQFTNFVIRNNIFDRAVHELTQTYTMFETTKPEYHGNTYIQGLGNKLYHHGLTNSAYVDIATGYNIRNVLGDTTSSIYYVENIPLYSFSYTLDEFATVTELDRMPNKTAADTEIFQPLVLRTSKNNNLYSEKRNSYTVQTAIDAETGISYADVTLVNNSAALNMDCYNLPRYSVESGTVYYKILMRTNQQVAPTINVYSLKDADGVTISGGASGTASTTTLGNDEWETVIIEVSTFPNGAATSAQIHLMFAGNNVKGSAYFDSDGNLIDNAYFDIASWAAFSNLASAEVYNLINASK